MLGHSASHAETIGKGYYQAGYVRDGQSNLFMISGRYKYGGMLATYPQGRF